MADQIDHFLEHAMRAQLDGEGTAPGPDHPGAPWPPAFGEEQARLAWQRIRFHGIAYQAALCADDSWPADLRDAVRQEAFQQSFWQISHAGAIRRLLEAFAHGAGHGTIGALVLKGTALAHALYPDPAARRRGDTDLLVRPADVGRARAALRACGFVPRTNPHGLQFQETWLHETGIGLVHAVDLHWRLGESPLYLEALDMDGCFARARPIRADAGLGGEARMPALVDTFIHGIFNQAWHRAHGYLVEGERMRGPARLIWLIDNARLIGAMSEEDWQQLARRAVAHGFAPLCLAAIARTHAALGVAAPAPAVARLRGAPRQTDLAMRLENPDLLACFLIDFRALRSWREKLALLAAHALPSGAHLREKYPDQSGWPLPLLHARRFAATAARWRRLRAR